MIINTNFDRNSALVYGNDIVDYPSSLKLIYNGRSIFFKDNITPKITNYGSGLNPGLLIIQLLSSDGSIFIPPSSSTCLVDINYSLDEEKPSSARISGDHAPTFNSYIKGFNITGLSF